MRCPSCGHENPHDAVFCNQCGTALTSIVCSNCATQNPPNSKFCKRCGIWLLTAPVIATAQEVLVVPQANAQPTAEAGASAPSDGTSATELRTPVADPVPTLHASNVGAIAPDAANQRKTCARCGTINEMASQFCFHCGWSLAGAPIGDVRIGIPAGFWLRLLAFLIDAVILTVAGLGVDAGVGGAVALQGTDFWTFFKDSIFTWAMLIRMVMSVLYYTILIGAAGATVGKLVLGIRVVRKDGSKVGYARAFCRWLAYGISLLTLGLGFVWIAFNKDRRGVHDYLVGTKVIRRA